MIRGCTHVDEPIDYFNKWYHKQSLIFRGHGVVDLEEEVKRKDSSN